MPEFLERIGAWGRNRDEGTSGLCLAGLLMFGRAEVIRDALPHYRVDYLERPDARIDQRWIDRLVPDGGLDLFWLKDDSLDNLDDLPAPDVLQQEMIEHLEAALVSFRDVAAGLAHKG